MLRFILRILLFVLAVRFVGGLLRALTGGGSQRLDDPRGGPPRMPVDKPPKPMVDRSSAIDVPFTEEPREI
jgi:hypothetical protein